MEIQYYGANCVKITDNKNSVVIDDNLTSLGLKKVASSSDIILYTRSNPDNEEGFLINGPGEYEIADLSIKGIATKAHIDQEMVTLYSINIDDYNIGVVGHIDANLSDDQLEELGIIDVLLIPVGGHGYTLDAEEAVSIIKKIEPKIVIPTHYADNSIKYEVPQAEIDEFLKALGVSDPEQRDSLTLKEKELNDNPKVIVLKRRESK